MRKYNVKEVTPQGSLTIVRLEPQKEKLLLEEEIPPGCIQHIILSLSKHGKVSEDLCNRICKMLCSVYMDDYSSRKTQKTSAKHIF